MRRWLFWVVLIVFVTTVVLGALLYISRPRISFVTARDLQSVVQATPQTATKVALVTTLQDALSEHSFPVLDKYGEKHHYDVRAYTIDKPEGLIEAVHKALQEDYEYIAAFDASVLLSKLEIPLVAFIQKYLEGKDIGIVEDCYSRFSCTNLQTAWKTGEKFWLTHSPPQTHCLLLRNTETTKRCIQEWLDVFQQSSHPCSMNRQHGVTFVFQKCIYPQFKSSVSMLPANIWVSQDGWSSTTSMPVMGIQSENPDKLEEFKNGLSLTLPEYGELIPRIIEEGEPIVRPH